MYIFIYKKQTKKKVRGKKRKAQEVPVIGQFSKNHLTPFVTSFHDLTVRHRDQL